MNIDRLTKRLVNRRVVLTLGVALLSFPGRLLACAVCLTGGANDPVQDAFNWSVLFLMAAPYTIVGSIGGWLFYLHRRPSPPKNGPTAASNPIFRLRWATKGSGK
ncbi:MAG: hypothetical protein ACREQK_04565 [Candidatus Binatia bacterium]